MVAKKKPVKKRTPAKKKTTRKSSVGSAPGAGLKKYNRAIESAPAVKREAIRIKKLETDLKAAKKKKAAAKKVAQKKYRATH